MRHALQKQALKAVKELATVRRGGAAGWGRKACGQWPGAGEGSGHGNGVRMQAECGVGAGWTRDIRTSGKRIGDKAGAVALAFWGRGKGSCV